MIYVFLNIFFYKNSTLYCASTLGNTQSAQKSSSCAVNKHDDCYYSQMQRFPMAAISRLIHTLLNVVLSKMC